jgi:hypothetical protein
LHRKCGFADRLGGERNDLHIVGSGLSMMLLHKLEFLQEIGSPFKHRRAEKFPIFSPMSPLYALQQNTFTIHQASFLSCKMRLYMIYFWGLHET